MRLKDWLLWAFAGVFAGSAMLAVYYFAFHETVPQMASAAPSVASPPPLQPVAATIEGPSAPARLATQIEALGNGFDGKVGIAIHSVEDGWTIAFNGNRPFPQQSVSKLWVAAAIMGKVDAGELSLTDTIPLTEADLTIFHQPIRKKIMAGGYRPALSELLFFAMTQSDNAANEALFRRAGGKAGVEGFLTARRLSGITLAKGERELQMGIAAMQWDPAFSHGRAFWHARNLVPWQMRKDAIEAYVRNPADGATPLAVAQGLAKLQQGTLLSAPSTATLLDLMAQSRTGPDRLRSGLSEGWSLPHKTGTGQVLQMLHDEHAGIFTAYNDVGILTSPRGKHYALVVMIGRTMRRVPERQALMSAVTQSVIAHEEGSSR